MLLALRQPRLRRRTVPTGGRRGLLVAGRVWAGAPLRRARQRVLAKRLRLPSSVSSLLRVTFST